MSNQQTASTDDKMSVFPDPTTKSGKVDTTELDTKALKNVVGGSLQWGGSASISSGGDRPTES